MTKRHISFSELKTWAECPYKHKLKYIDGINGFTGNAFTAFGTAIHSVCEFIAKGELDPVDYDEHFDLAFLCELKKLEEKPTMTEHIGAPNRDLQIIVTGWNEETDESEMAMASGRRWKTEDARRRPRLRERWRSHQTTGASVGGAV